MSGRPRSQDNLNSPGLFLPPSRRSPTVDVFNPMLRGRDDGEDVEVEEGTGDGRRGRANSIARRRRTRPEEPGRQGRGYRRGPTAIAGLNTTGPSPTGRVVLSPSTNPAGYCPDHGTGVACPIWRRRERSGLSLFAPGCVNRNGPRRVAGRRDHHLPSGRSRTARRRSVPTHRHARLRSRAETWKSLPGAVVKCAWRHDRGGIRVLVAHEEVTSP